MKVTYTKDNSGIKAGHTKTLPDALALKMIEKGICKAADSADPLETEEEKASNKGKGKAKP